MSAERRREKRWKQKGRNERKRAIQVQREIVGRTMTQKMRENEPLVVMSQRSVEKEKRSGQDYLFHSVDGQKKKRGMCVR